MFFTKEWLEKRYSYVVYRRGSGYLGVQISSGGRNRQGVQPGFPGISSKYASYGMERIGSFLLVVGMPGWHPGSAGSLRHHPALRPLPHRPCQRIQGAGGSSQGNQHRQAEYAHQGRGRCIPLGLQQVAAGSSRFRRGRPGRCGGPDRREH